MIFQRTLSREISFKLFGQIRTSVDDNGKEHSNIRIFSSKLLKAKEQMRGQEEKKEASKEAER